MNVFFYGSKPQIKKNGFFLRGGGGGGCHEVSGGSSK